MSTPNTDKAPLTRKHVFAQSWPIMLANGAAPIVGLVDTWVIGRYVGTSALAGIGLGAVIYGVVYWGFGFLRMSTAGLDPRLHCAHGMVCRDWSGRKCTRSTDCS